MLTWTTQRVCSRSEDTMLATFTRFAPRLSAALGPCPAASTSDGRPAARGSMTWSEPSPQPTTTQALPVPGHALAMLVTHRSEPRPVVRVYRQRSSARSHVRSVAEFPAATTWPRAGCHSRTRPGPLRPVMSSGMPHHADTSCTPSAPQIGPVSPPSRPRPSAPAPPAAPALPLAAPLELPVDVARGIAPLAAPPGVPPEDDERAMLRRTESGSASSSESSASPCAFHTRTMPSFEPVINRHLSCSLIHCSAVRRLMELASSPLRNSVTRVPAS
mmetsp:Transcript_20509/g.72492  ORF Transcript_20509/g.72492 Transcript_20509/m.72492 type:complete len:274 (+) Transcript_20509:401-1222(+)